MNSRQNITPKHGSGWERPVLCACVGPQRTLLAPAGGWRCRSRPSGSGVAAVACFFMVSVIRDLLSLFTMGVVAFGTLSRAVLFLCCIGIQSRGSVKLPLNMLWLFYFLFMIPGVDAVICRSCFGDAPDCSGETAQCPWVKDVAANAVAVTAAAGGIITLEKVLPNKFVRLFTGSPRG